MKSHLRYGLMLTDSDVRYDRYLVSSSIYIPCHFLQRLEE